MPGARTIQAQQQRTRSTEQCPRSCSTCACSARCFQPRGAKVAWEPSAGWQGRGWVEESLSGGMQNGIEAAPQASLSVLFRSLCTQQC